MKLVVESLEQLYEVGEITLPPYNYRRGKDTIMASFYYFITEDNDNYMVRFYNIGEIRELTKDLWMVEFLTSSEKSESEIINKGRIFRVLSTVASIIKEFVKEKNPEEIKISPAKNFRKDKRRFNIYLRFISKNLPPEYKIKTNIWNDNILIKRVKD
jgi:hypothetical protein